MAKYLLLTLNFIALFNYSAISQNVGIGTNSPQEKLHIDGSIRGNVSGAVRINTGNGYVDVGPQNSGWSHFQTDRPRFYFNKGITVDEGLIGSYNQDFQLQTSGTTRMTLLNSNGNIGIGNNSPVAKLQVSGDIIRTNTRVSASQSYPVGRSFGNTLFSIDPTWTNAELQTFFNSTNVQWFNDATAPGGYAIQITNPVNVGGNYNSGFPYIPVEEGDVYYMECWIRSSAANVGHYMGSIDYDQNFSSLGGNPGSFGYWVMLNTTPGTSWVKVSGTITGFGNTTGQFKTGTKYFTPQALFNYSNGSGATTYISGWKVIRLQKGSEVAAGSSNYIQNQFSNNQSASFRISGTGQAGAFQASTASNEGGNISLINPNKTGSNANRWTLYNMTGGYGNSFQIWSYPENGTPACCISRFIINDNGTTSLVPSGGNVGIGTTTPNTKLNVIGVDDIGNSAVNYTVNQGISGVAVSGNISSVSNTYAGAEGSSNATNGVGVKGLHLPSSGAGIGVYGITNNPFGTAWAGYFSGDVGGFGFYNISDERLKHKSTSLSDVKVLDKLLQVEPMSYEYNLEKYPGLGAVNGKRYFGFMAQELNRVFPELVATNKGLPDVYAKSSSASQQVEMEKGFYVVDYVSMVPILVQAIKEQQEIISDLKERIELLEKK